MRARVMEEACPETVRSPGPGVMKVRRSSERLAALLSAIETIRSEVAAIVRDERKRERRHGHA